MQKKKTRRNLLYNVYTFCGTYPEKNKKLIPITHEIRELPRREETEYIESILKSMKHNKFSNLY